MDIKVLDMNTDTQDKVKKRQVVDVRTRLSKAEARITVLESVVKQIDRAMRLEVRQAKLPA
jgi:hypothetical protein